MTGSKSASLAAWVLCVVWVWLLAFGHESWRVVFVADWMMTGVSYLCGAIEELKHDRSKA